MSQIPMIDVSGLSGTADQKLDVARRIGSACEEIGFFCITGHGVDPGLIREVRQAALAFFDLSAADKLKVERQPPAFRGYIGLQTEGLSRSMGVAGANDFKEAFSMGPVAAPPGGNRGAAANYAPNRWPEHPAAFQRLFEAYYRVMSDLAARLMGGFALALGLSEEWFADKLDHHISNVRALHYPEQPEGALPGQLRAGAHTDYGSLTILLTQDAPGGLNVRTQTGEWIDVPSLPGSFVVNIGDLMAQWTNDRFVSTLHRVVNPPAGAGTRRLSIAFFHQPNHDAVIECIDTCRGAGERYAPVTSGEHRLLKVSRANAAG